MDFLVGRIPGTALACITHPVLKTVFFTERTEARTEDTEANPVSARWAVWAWLRALWTNL